MIHAVFLRRHLAMVVTLVIGLSGALEAVAAQRVAATDPCPIFLQQSRYTANDPGISSLHLCTPMSRFQTDAAQIINDSSSVWWFEKLDGSEDLPRNPSLPYNQADEDIEFNAQFHDFAEAQGRTDLYLLPGETIDLEQWEVTSPHSDAGLTTAYNVQRFVEERMNQVPGESEAERILTTGSPARKALWSCSMVAYEKTKDVLESGDVFPRMYKLINQSISAGACVKDWREWRAAELESNPAVLKVPSIIKVVAPHPPASDAEAGALKRWLSKVLLFCEQHCRR